MATNAFDDGDPSYMVTLEMIELKQFDMYWIIVSMQLLDFQQYNFGSIRKISLKNYNFIFIAGAI